MVEQQAGALLVGVVEGLAAIVVGLADSGSAIQHVGHIRDTDTLRPHGVSRQPG